MMTPNSSTYKVIYYRNRDRERERSGGEGADRKRESQVRRT